MAVRRIVPDLHAPDPTAGAEFYAQVLGLELVMDLGWVATFAAPGKPTAQITIMSQDATAPVRPDVSIEVDDVDAALPLTHEPWGVRRFFVRDPSGKVLNVLGHG